MRTIGCFNKRSFIFEKVQAAKEKKNRTCDQGPEEALLWGISTNAAGSFALPRFTHSHFVMYISCDRSLFMKEFMNIHYTCIYSIYINALIQGTVTLFADAKLTKA